MTDGNGRPLGLRLTSANGDERQQVKKLITSTELLLSYEDIVFLEADKGYDSKKLRCELLLTGIYPLIPHRRNRSSISHWVKRVRWKVEKSISGLKRGYRQVATRWERLMEAYEGIVLLAICYFWVKKIVG